ncbi:CBS domain-containing protein [uncultured Thiocystis sp.]|jgi:CBS domain-containing protein|uniref:CBS domain-containing protein n=1 Tax=uncultured Thiocystis sp. TaxID=1202134 RepID=UPI0025DC69AA|nr:CBS domain-containing protein [uncultured Thiocystis sp.]
MIYRNIGALIANQQTLTMPPTGTVLDAACLMAERRVGAIAVVDRGDLVGLFTERDLLNRVVALGRDPGAVTINEVMTHRPVTIREHQSLAEGLDIMFGHHFRHLPVLDEAGALLGVLSCRDIPPSYWVMRERWIEAHQSIASVA